MNSDFYTKLVDLYAGDELPTELDSELKRAAYANPDLNQDMATLRQTVEALHQDDGVDFTEESYQRILIKMYARGVNVEPKAKAPIHLQYHLPMQG